VAKLYTEACNETNSVQLVARGSGRPYSARMNGDEKRYMVMTAVGPDRPGLVERVATLIHTAGANLEDSRMAILGGEFALILLFSGDKRSVDLVIRQSGALESELGLHASVRPTARQSSGADFLPYLLRINGVDRPGIVARVTAVLAARRINVAALDSRVTYAPLSGTPLFQLEAQLQVPSEVALTALRSQLARVCDEENLDYQLEAER
jgi:glycine cleavage system transcriptional repressor